MKFKATIDLLDEPQVLDLKAREQLDRWARMYLAKEIAETCAAIHLVLTEHISDTARHELTRVLTILEPVAR